MDKVIDGVDVSGCEFYQIEANQLYPKAQYCGSMRNTFCENEPNCYYKQLKRKEQERNEWKKKYEDAANENLLEIYELIKKNDAWRGIVNVVNGKLEQENAELKAENERLKEELNNYKTSKENSYQNLKKEWQQCQWAIRKLTTENERLKEELRTERIHSSQIEELEESLQHAKAEIEELKKQVKNNETAYHTELGTYNMECGNLLEENKTLIAENERLKEEKQELNIEIVSLTSKLFTLEKSRNDLSQCANKLYKAIQKIKKYIAKICKEECGYVQKKRCPDSDCRFGAILDLITKAEEGNE